MNTKLTAHANAKINLSLDVVGRCENGYHEVKMVMQSVDLFDTVTVGISDSITLTCSDSSVPCGENNTAYAAAAEFFRHTGIEGGAKIHIDKRIPSPGGLGGPSADAAAVILLLDRLYGVNAERSLLCKIGLCVGADVPFCIYGGTAAANGVGEEIYPLPTLPGCTFVIVINGDKPSTGEMYSRVDSLQNPVHPDTSALVSAIHRKDIMAVAKNCANMFGGVWAEYAADICKDMLDGGAIGASLSGAGPSVFGIFTDEKSAEKYAKTARHKYRTVFTAKPASSGCVIIQ